MIDATKVIWISFFMSLLSAILVCFGFYFFIMPKLPPPPGWEIVSTQTSNPAQHLASVPKQVDVPDFTGSYPGQAKLSAETKGLYLVVEGEEPSKEYPKGVIISQRPLAGSAVQSGTTVYVTIAGEKRSVKIPFVRGLEQSVAQNQIMQAGLQVGKIEKMQSDSIPPGYVIKTLPLEGSSVAPETPIAIFVSAGPSLVVVPSLVGKYYTNASAILENAGLSLGNVRRVLSGEYPVNKIIGQSPNAGTKIPKGSKVDITVATVEEQMY